MFEFSKAKTSLSTVLVIATLVSGYAVPSQAQSIFSPPPGCTGKLTVQMRGCIVENIWTCEGDEPDEQWMSTFTSEGPSRVMKVDGEFQWLETYRMNPVSTERILLPAEDPQSLTDLFGTGLDTYDYMIDVDESGFSSVTRYVGYDRLTGERVRIDDEPLRVLTFDYKATDLDGALLRHTKGAQYVSDKHRLFFLGTFYDGQTNELLVDNSPVDFIYEGEEGFFSPNPKYDCGEMMSSAPNIAERLEQLTKTFYRSHPEGLPK